MGEENVKEISVLTIEGMAAYFSLYGRHLSLKYEDEGRLDLYPREISWTSQGKHFSYKILNCISAYSQWL